MAWQTLEPGHAFLLPYAFNDKGHLANSVAMKIRDGELLVISPSWRTSDADFADLEKHGRPTAIVAPSPFHHLGIPEWSKRYPDAKLYGASSTNKRMAKKHPGVRPFEPLSKLADVCSSDLVVLDPLGMRVPDVMARVSTPSGWLWFFNDTVMNFPELPKGFFGKIMQWTDSGPGFKVARFFTMFGVKEKKRFKEWWLAELDKAPPSKAVVGHGAPVLDASAASNLPRMVESAL